MDQKAIEDAGYDKGLKTGYDKGLKTGIAQGIKQIAKKMLNEKIDLDTISRITGLSIQELKKL